MHAKKHFSPPLSCSGSCIHVAQKHPSTAPQDEREFSGSSEPWVSGSVLGSGQVNALSHSLHFSSLFDKSEFLLPAARDKEWFQTSRFKKLLSWSSQLIIHCCLLFLPRPRVLEFLRMTHHLLQYTHPSGSVAYSSWNILLSEPKRQSGNVRLFSKKEFRSCLPQPPHFINEKQGLSSWYSLPKSDSEFMAKPRLESQFSNIYRSASSKK